MNKILLIMLLVTICWNDWEIITSGEVTGQVVCDTRDGEFV